MPALRLTGKTATPPYGRSGFERQENGAGFSERERENHGSFSQGGLAYRVHVALVTMLCSFFFALFGHTLQNPRVIAAYARL